MIGDNGGYQMDWVPYAKCCGNVLGYDKCVCPTCADYVEPRIHPLIELGEN